MKKTPEQLRREKRRRAISNKVEKYKDKILTEEHVIELLDDALWLVKDLNRMQEEVMKWHEENPLL